MSDRNDRAMDAVCRDLIALSELDTGRGIFDDLAEWQTKVIEKTLLIEAHCRGEDITKTKLAMIEEDINALDWRERVERVSKALISATNWQAKRSARLH